MTARDRDRRERRTGTRLLFLGAAAFLGLATWLVLDRRAVWGGAAAAASGVCLLAGATLARRGSAADWIAGSILDRAFEGCVFASIVWAVRSSDPPTSAGALVALGAGFLAAYVRSRAVSLGYEVDESPVTRGLRYGIPSVGLLTDAVDVAVYAAAALALLSTLIRTSQVVKEERA